MTQTDTGATLNKLRKMIQTLLTCPHSPYQSKFQKSEVCKIN